MKHYQISKSSLEKYFNDQINTISEFNCLSTKINIVIQDMDEEYIDMHCYADVSTLLINKEYQLFFRVLSAVFPTYFTETLEQAMSVNSKGDTYLQFSIETNDLLKSVSIITEYGRRIITRYEDNLRIAILNKNEHIVVITAEEVSTKEQRQFLYFAVNREEAIKMFNQEKYSLIKEYSLDFQIIQIMDMDSLYVPVEVCFGPVVDRELKAYITLNKQGEIVFNYRYDVNQQTIILERPYDEFKLGFRKNRKGETELFAKDDVAYTFINSKIKIPKYILESLLNKLCKLIDIRLKVSTEGAKQNPLYMMDTSDLVKNLEDITSIRRKLYTGRGSEYNSFKNNIPEFGPDIINIIDILNFSSYKVYVKPRITERVNNAYHIFNRQVKKRMTRESDPAYMYGTVVTVEEYMDSEKGAINVHAYNYGAVYSVPELKLPQEGKPFLGYSGIRL